MSLKLDKNGNLIEVNKEFGEINTPKYVEASHPVFGAQTQQETKRVIKVRKKAELDKINQDKALKAAQVQKAADNVAAYNKLAAQVQDQKNKQKTINDKNSKDYLDRKKGKFAHMPFVGNEFSCFEAGDYLTDKNYKCAGLGMKISQEFGANMNCSNVNDGGLGFSMPQGVKRAIRQVRAAVVKKPIARPSIAPATLLARQRMLRASMHGVVEEFGSAMNCNTGTMGFSLKKAVSKAAAPIKKAAAVQKKVVKAAVKVTTKAVTKPLVVAKKVTPIAKKIALAPYTIAQKTVAAQIKGTKKVIGMASGQYKTKADDQAAAAAGPLDAGATGYADANGNPITEAEYNRQMAAQANQDAWGGGSTPAAASDSWSDQAQATPTAAVPVQASTQDSTWDDTATTRAASDDWGDQTDHSHPLTAATQESTWDEGTEQTSQPAPAQAPEQSAWADETDQADEEAPVTRKKGLVAKNVAAPTITPTKTVNTSFQHPLLW